jgi:AraC-like DNA-binding protein
MIRLVRTRVVRTDLGDGLGLSTRAIRAADPRLRPLLFRPLYGFEQQLAGFASWLEPPRPAVTLIVDLDGAISVDGEPLPDAWLGGLGDRYSVVGFGGGRYASLDIELTPLGAYRVLGMPLSELRGRCVALEDLFGDEGRRLTERMRGTVSWDARFDVLEQFLLARAAIGPAPTPAVQWAMSVLRETGGQARIQTLATELGCSRRYLTERFTAEVGLAPKTVARQIRFARVCARARERPGAWARIAAEAGYCDQAHLNRDFRELAGTTPTDFIARLLPGGGVVGDGLPFVQDAAGAAA